MKNSEEYINMKNMYLKIMEEKNMKKQEKIDYLEERKFYINMIDRWDNDDRLAYGVVVDLLKELDEINEIEVK